MVHHISGGRQDHERRGSAVHCRSIKDLHFREQHPPTFAAATRDANIASGDGVVEKKLVLMMLFKSMHNKLQRLKAEKKYWQDLVMPELPELWAQQ